MTWNQPVGQGMDAVREALHEMSSGTGDFPAVLAAVEQARFAVRPTALNLDELAANWEYQPMADTFTDTVQAALFDGTLTMAEYVQLSDVAKFVGPEPSRVDS